jgi:hypothetical protein
MNDSSNAQSLKQRIQEVLSDEAFANELLQMEDPGDVQKALEEKGIELTLDEIRRIKERAIKVQSGEDLPEQQESLADGELSEDELLDVAGGDGWTYTDVERWFSS